MVTGVSRRVGRPLVAGRWAGAVLLFVMAWIHLQLWLQGYREIALIGPAFLANTVGGIVLAAAVLTATRRWLAAAAALAALFALGTLAGLLLSATVGLFGFFDTLDTHLATTSLVVEALGVVVLTATAALARRAHRASERP